MLASIVRTDNRFQTRRGKGSYSSDVETRKLACEGLIKIKLWLNLKSRNIDILVMTSLVVLETMALASRRLKDKMCWPRLGLEGPGLGLDLGLEMFSYSVQQ